MAGIFYNKLGFIFRADVAGSMVHGELKKNVCALLFYRINSNLFAGLTSEKSNAREINEIIRHGREGGTLRSSIAKSMIERR